MRGDFNNDPFLRSIREIIDRHGQYVVAVHLTEQDPPGIQPFIYTIGNHERGLPELLIVGTAETGFGQILNQLGRLQRERGRAFADEELIGIGGKFPVRMVDAGSLGREQYATLVRAFYDTERYDVRQVLLPDTKGRWPEDPACDKPYCEQPVLSRTGKSVQ